ncbi:MAG: 2Fe-2S iron-sulfur cluster-binding protein [Deltaproteobacteria bacterium]|nr:2Fe-2S iron-sulfur cluster-binding protein [Deltaproteobacteria bacterium]
MTARRVDHRAVRAQHPEGVLRAVYDYAALDSAQTCGIRYDGRALDARVGEPLALSLLANGIDTLSRSVKFHRPRGPMCLRGNCEGCLTRVDDDPNTMACVARAHDGREIRSQNAFPSAELDVLRITDWFFPKSFDHHHLMVRYGPAINQVMQSFARKMAGLGTLPTRASEPMAPLAMDCDVLVVGLGPAGLALAAQCAQAGLKVVAVDEEPDVGGFLRDSLQWHTHEGARVCAPAWCDLQLAKLRALGVSVRLGAAACATFDDGTLVITGERALWVRARARVFANGSHESVGNFENNDLPGIYTERAVARALRQGVRVGATVLLTGGSDETDALALALSHTDATVHRVQPGETLRGAKGMGDVSGAVLVGPKGERTVSCDAIGAENVRTPAFELAGQAGVEPRASLTRRCFVAHSHEAGRTERRDVFVVGSVRSEGDTREPDWDATVSASVIALCKETAAQTGASR